MTSSVYSVFSIETTHSTALALTKMAEGASSLVLLRLIDEAVTTCSSAVDVFNAFTKSTVEVTESIKTAECAEGMYIDEDDKCILALDDLRASLIRALSTSQAMRSGVARGKDRGRLKDHHCDLLNGTLDDLITAVESAIDAADEFQAAIISYDLRAEPRPSSGVPLQELLSSLKD